MMLPRLHYDVTVPARIQSLLSAVCEQMLAEKQMSCARHICSCMGNEFYKNTSAGHKISDRKMLKHIYWNLRERQTLVFAAVEESKDLSRNQNWKTDSSLMWPARRCFQLQITETEDKHRILLKKVTKIKV